MPQPGWILYLAINGNTSLDAALEEIFFAKDLTALCHRCDAMSGQECARLSRLPATLAIAVKRGQVGICFFVATQLK